MYKVIVVALLAVSSASAFHSACTNLPNAIRPSDIQSSACSGSQCIVTRGETLIADATIAFTKTHSRLDVRVTAYILGIPVNLPQSPPDDNACNSMFVGGTNVGCPTRPGQSHVWRINFSVPASYPAFSNTRVRCKFEN